MSQDALIKGNDAVDRIVTQWRTERPDLDPSAKEVTGRVVRLGTIFQRRYSEAFASLDIADGHYGVLVALRRAGAPFELTPTDLARQRMITSGGLTPVLDHLERNGLVARAPNPADRRGRLVRLTSAGRKLVDKAMDVHTAAEHELVAALSLQEREQLTKLLRKVLLSVDTD